MTLRRRPITPETTLLLDPSTGAPRAVSSGFPRESWRTRQPAAHGRAAHPGTALKIGENLFEIVAERPDPERPVATVYDLAPWDDSFTIRAVDEVTPQACREAAQRHRANQQRERRGTTLHYLAFLTGLLPAEDQSRIEREYGVPAMRATFLSAIPLLGGSTLALFVAFAAARGHTFGAWTGFALHLQYWIPLFLYLVAESIVRIAMGLASQDPLGSLLVAGPIAVFRSLFAAGRETSRSPAKLSAHAFSTVRDTVRPWRGPEADLEVRSRLPKDHWTVNTSGIAYQGKVYRLADRQVLTEGDERYRFLLELPQHEVLWQHYWEYQPEEVREIYRERRRRDAATWVETFRLFWGWLDHDRQERLSNTYLYVPQTMTRLSILFNVLLGGLAAVQGFTRLTELGGLIDFVELLFGLALLWECAVRWSHWRAGHWRPSFLSVLVRPLADGFLRWEKR